MDPILYFWLFFKASLFSIGGLGNLPFLNQDLIDLDWATPSDFVTAIAVGNLSPGPNGLWSVSLGYLTFGWAGALLALLALSLPPLLILVVSAFYNRIEHQPVAQDFTRGLTLGVVGLTLAVSVRLANASITDLTGVLIMLVAMVLALSKKVPIILIFVLAAATGAVLDGFF
ncbi:MAG: chromate transporter [Chloroflexi bacterium]|nr:chromate transporter [Chloroflexota bacterium]